MRVNEVEEALDDDDTEADVKPEPGADDGPEALRARKRAKRRHLATIANGPKQGRIPLPELRGRSLQIRLDHLKEMRQRVDLSASALPSACMYTLFNTASRLHCLTTSSDSTMIAGGFADSYVKVWDLTRKGLRGLKSSEELKDLDIDSSTTLEDLQDAGSAEDCKTLIGHTGPVYSTSFSPDNAFLLSGSEDGTARLWDLHTFTNVVAYVYHRLPLSHFLALSALSIVVIYPCSQIVACLLCVQPRVAHVAPAVLWPHPHYLCRGCR
jgi:transcription initiation factor TFIID subunit 5